jgi:hypothetical protein
MKYDNGVLEAAHKRSIFHKDEILNSNLCGCFYCLTTFHPNQIIEWVDEDKTALCPNCGIDSVISDKSGFLINDDIFLKEMHERWFN